MAQTPSFSAHTPVPLPDVFTEGLTELFTQSRPAIVQIRNARRGGGTGFIWQADGRVLTNHHVVPGNHDTISVLFTDGREFPAHVLQRNPQLDLAVLQIESNEKNFPTLPLGDSSHLRVGEWVFAIGHPWGQRWAVTAGIVSAISTITFRQGNKTQYIKSDVRLAPGNSGGPLLNADGQVVGINAMIFGGDLSVSIPTHIINKWLNTTPVQPGRKRLGIEIQTIPLPSALQQQLQPTRGSGVLIIGTMRPETLHDLLVGDIILDVAGRPVTDGTTLRQEVTRQSTQATVEIRLYRGGNIITSKITLID